MIMRSLRNTERVLHNPAADKVLEIEGRGAPNIQDLIPYVSGLVGKEMLEAGDVEKATMAAGQCIGLIRDIPTCRELLDRIMADAEAIIKTRLARMLAEKK